MSVTMSATPPSETRLDTKFWIICREENQLTQQLAREINYWKIVGVRARLGHQMSLAAAHEIAGADYAIFVTLCEQPCSHIQLHPVSNAQSDAVQSPVSFLNTLRKRHGSTPQSWWLQLPTTEIRHQGIKHIPTEQTLSKALTQIEVFVRNYYLHSSFRGAPPSQAQQRVAVGNPSIPTEKVLQVA